MGLQHQWRRLVARVTGWERDAYVPLRIALTADEQQVFADKTSASVVAGYVRKSRLERVRAFREVFEVTESHVLMNPDVCNVDERSHAFLEVASALRSEGMFPTWQDEMYATKTSYGAHTLFHYNRGVGAYFGLSQFATHLNGFVRNAKNRSVSHLWIAKRSMHKKKWPGQFDTIVGGGLPANISALDNMVKESEEEASLSPSWTSSQLVSTGSIGYVLDERSGLQNNMMFIYDLELPESMEPVNRDGEVESFELWSIQDVLEALADEPERFKPDICLVLLDFCVRHGIFTPDNFSTYHELQLALRGEQNPYLN
ncbi:Rna-binding protein, partial [Globisporangium splendens]